MKIAIDIVLMLPQSVIDLVTRTNERARERGECTIVIDGKKRMPHISLLMGMIDEEKIEEISERTQQIATRFHPLELIADHIGRDALGIQKTDAITALHERLIEHIGPLLYYERPTAEMFDEPAGTDLGKYWEEFPQNFITKYSREKFWPHITTGSLRAEPASFPIHFTTSAVALYRLGAHCTCTQQLASFVLH